MSTTSASLSFLYIMAANATSVDVLALIGPGKAKKISTLDISRPARAAGVPIGAYGLLPSKSLTVVLDRSLGLYQTATACRA